MQINTNQPLAVKAATAIRYNPDSYVFELMKNHIDDVIRVRALTNKTSRNIFFTQELDPIPVGSITIGTLYDTTNFEPQLVEYYRKQGFKVESLVDSINYKYMHISGW